MPSRPRPSRRRRALLLLVPLAVVAAAAGIWLTTRGDDELGAGRGTPAAAPTTRSPAPVTDDLSTLGPERTGGAPVPTAPPSEVATDGAAEGGGSDATGPAGDSADVVLTFAGWDDATSAVEAGGYVAGARGEGTCTLTLTAGGPARSTSGPSFSDATSMSCGTLRIPGDELGSGTWEAVLSFTSSGASGESAPTQVQVP